MSTVGSALPLLLVAALAASGCIQASDDVIHVPYSDVANARERFFELIARTPHPSPADPELHDFLGAYQIATAVQPSHRGELHFVVLDEQGNSLNGVRIKTFRIEGVDSKWEPKGQSSEITVNGEYRMRWPNHDPLELELSKDGYRPINVGFYGRDSADSRRYGVAWEMLERGWVLAPREPDGPIRIVLPPAVRWDPENGYPWGPRDYTPGSADRMFWPKEVPHDCPILVTSNNPRVVPAPVRGTYALINGKGEILSMVQLDPGNLMNISVYDVDPKLGITERFLDTGCMGSSEKQSSDGEPYEWRLYSVATPLHSTTQP